MNLLQKNLNHLRIKMPDLGIDLEKNYTLSQLEDISMQSNIPLENLILFNLSAQHLPWASIKFIFLDVDGVLTEGGMFYTEEKKEFKRFDTKDGMAIKTAMKHDIEFGIISSGVNKKIIQHRADMFGIKHLYVGTEPKLGVAKSWLSALHLEWSQIGYIGDDINDLQMFEKAAIAACPADATNPIKAASSFVLESKGGFGCVREFARYLPSLKSVL